MKGQKILSELFQEGTPVRKAEATVPSFTVEFSGCPVGATTRCHEGHYPTNLGGIVGESLWIVANVGPTRRPEGHPSGAVAIEFRWQKGLKTSK